MAEVEVQLVADEGADTIRGIESATKERACFKVPH